LHKFLRKKLVYLQSIKSLEKLKWWKNKFYSILPDFVFTSIGKPRSELLKQENLKEMGRENNKTEFLGRPLEEMVLTEEGIPHVLALLKSYISNENLDQQGLFRVAGSLSEEQKLINALKINNFDYLLSIQDVKTVAGVFKKILAELPVPVFPFEAYERVKQLKCK
jgi:hypothetical protein